MIPVETPTSDPAELALALLAVDPPGLGGIVLDHPAHERARAYCNALTALLPGGAPMRRIPLGITADRLIGGIDLAATLSAGRLVGEPGLLANADGGFVVLPMAERASTTVRAALAEALDRGSVRVARDGISATHDARVAAIVLDESVEDESVHATLRDRMAFHVALTSAHTAESLTRFTAAIGPRVKGARPMYSGTTVDEGWIEALCAVAAQYGVDGVRAPLLALRVARAHAALCGRYVVGERDVELAARLVLAPRATRLPENIDEREEPGDESLEPPSPSPEASERPSTAPDASSSRTESEPETGEPSPQAEILRAAVAAAIPPGLLNGLLSRLSAGNTSGRVGAEQESPLRGRPRDAIAGTPDSGKRLHLLATLRAAAPWQRVRTRRDDRLAIRRADFRVRRFVERTGSTVLFVVDASGSSALQRLAEAKGAVELLLSESYTRRDRVSLLAFRGSGTETLLPPTRAIARARRVLAALPGGGGTPLAHAIETSMHGALTVRRGGSAPLVVLLTDGRANISRDGSAGRAAAERDALEAAAAFARHGIAALFVDTSPRGEAVARRVAGAMRARYAALPGGDRDALGALVRTAIALPRDGGSSA